MNKKLITLLSAIICLCTGTAFGQVSVDPQTGAANVVIPIYTFSSGQVSLPVSLSYNGSGVKPKDVENTAGIGWQLNAGGQVTRVVRGLPDDCTKDNSLASMYGWMSASDTAPAAISGLTIYNNGSTCSDETTDISNITSSFSPAMDTEPDLFYVSAPGLSCELVYDRVSNTFKPVHYQDLVIGYGTDPTSHLITSFTITNDKGITYSFGNDADLAPAYELVTQTTSGGSQVYFKTKYTQYKNGVTYYDNWGLTSINDSNGNGIQLNYTSASPARSSTDSVALYIGGDTSSSPQYYIHQKVTPYTLQSIQTFNAYAYSSTSLAFNWGTLSMSGETGQTVITSIVGMGRDFQFSYSPVVYTSSGYTRNFLRSFSDPNCSTPINYQFGYVGETGGGLSGPSYTTILPDSASNQTDYWGYYTTMHGTTPSQIPSILVNPSTPSYPRYLIHAANTEPSAYSYYFSNMDRAADTVNVATGCLNYIGYVQGGSTTIVYQSNDYLDVPENATVVGGGVRVRQVIESPATGATNAVTRNYSYTNPATGLSSGKPISLPQYAFTIPLASPETTYALWNEGTALSAHDLSTEDHTIMYAYSRQSQTGAGYTVYQYDVPATFWDASATPDCSGCTTAEWYPTTNYVGRANCTSTYGYISNYTYSYPFIPNPNYDFERGLPVKITSYTDAGSEVSEADYTYVRSYSPTPIIAFKYDINPNGSLSTYGYNKYTLYYGTSELTATVVKKIFDSSLAGTSLSTTSNYSYNSANHKLLTKSTVTNSDGSVLTNNISYTKDYTAAAGTNANVTAIYNMQLQNINVPVESYQQVTRGSGSALTTTGSLTLFRDTTVGTLVHCLPSKQYKWFQPAGATLTPMTISGQTLTMDGNYFDAANYDIYDNTGFPLTVDDNYKHIKTTLLNHFANQPIAVFSNAAYNQVAYSDFDADQTSPAYGFTISGTGSYSPVGSHAGNAAGITSAQTVTSPTLTKNSLAVNYIFSIWINAATAGSLNITIAGTSAISYPITTGWTYYEVKIPASGIASTFTVSFSSTQSISIDDVLFYPDAAQAATATYDPVSRYKLDATNTNGVSSYFTNDQWGRVLYVFDQDKNIVQKNTFITPADAGTFTSAAITGSTAPVNGQAVGYSIFGPDACAAAGTSVTWNFGDGTIVNSAGLTSPTHTYTGVGTVYTLNATVSSPLFGTKVMTPLTVTVAPASIPLSYASHTMGDGDISNVTFTPVGGGTPVSFTNSQLNSGHIPQGNYTIVVSLSDGVQYTSGPAGYNSVLITGGSTYSACQNWLRGNTYTFSANISNSTGINFSVYQTVCSPL